MKARNLFFSVLAIMMLALPAVDSFAATGHNKKKAKEERDTLLYPDSYLDTVKVGNTFKLNDYSTIGFEYGISRNNVSFNPAYETTPVWNQGYYSILYTLYGKMFGYMPYFGLRVGATYATEGFMFKADEETHKIAALYGDCIGEQMHIVEVPIMAHMHMDARYFKVIADVGIYGAYRLDMSRTGLNEVIPADQFTFKSFENRLDYGILGGLGFGIVLSPFELQIGVKCRYSWGSLFEPNYQSEYYYKFAYPFDFIGTVGIHYQLTRRTGKSRSQLKKQAYHTVYDDPVVEEAKQNVRAN